jgi:hypothetical protein
MPEPKPVQKLIVAASKTNGPLLEFEGVELVEGTSPQAATVNKTKTERSDCFLNWTIRVPPFLLYLSMEKDC